MPEASYNATLIEREDFNEALIRFRVAYDETTPPPYLPGQFTNLGLPARSPEFVPASGGWVKRPYSVSSTPNDTTVEFFVRLVDNGALTPSLFQLQVGDKVWMDERFLGKFTLEALPETPAIGERHLLMISTGTGLAPFMSMLRAYHHSRWSPPMWERLCMLNGVRIESDLGYRQELEELARIDPHFTYVPMCSREREDGRWPGLKGRIPVAFSRTDIEERLGFELNPERVQILLCGNPEMIEDLTLLLSERGFKRHLKKDPGQIHLERYW